MPSSPPITELAMMVQFPAFSGATVLDYADFVQQFSDRFPLSQQVPRLDPIQVGSTQAMPSFQFGPVDPASLMPRIWQITSDSRRLIQFQNDRFGFNWRRIEPPGKDFAYPGYVALKDEFVVLFNEFSRWAESRFGDKPRPNAGELYYINAIPLLAGDDRKRISEIFRFYSPKSKRLIGGFQTSWWEEIKSVTPGTITQQASVGVLPDGSPVAVLNLLSRINLENAGTDPKAWFDIAHAQTLEMFESAIILDAEKDSK